MKTFPENVQLNKQTVIDIIFGHRLHGDQTLYEYLIEFLLIFISAKNINDLNESGMMRFHEVGEELKYYVKPNIGLKRFIFYDNAKKDKSISYDEDAYNFLFSELKKQLDCDEDEADNIIQAIQDLLRGYAVIMKSRTWCAQQTLPLCPELVFCEAMPNQNYRKNKVKSCNDMEIDTSFEFSQRNFLARGGEVYYLHLMQSLQNQASNENRKKMNFLLDKLLTEQSGNISNIAKIIQSTWEEIILKNVTDKKKMYQEFNITYIPAESYIKCGNYSVDELINYLSSDFQQIKKVDILAKGVMFQVMRMMHCAVVEELQIKQYPWILDMTNNTSSVIKKIANNSYKIVENDFKQAIKKVADKISNNDNIIKNIVDGQKHSLNIFRSKGKELRCIIPIKGSFERFTLSEDILRFLVLSLIAPTEKITFEMFLDRLFEHYNIVIGANQYDRFINGNNNSDDLTIKNSLYENEICFQNFLKSTGFLKELSDSTSLVFNPYNPVEMEDIL